MKWHKKVGDKVSRGDSLIDIETDKVTLEVAAPNDGILNEILKQDGEEVKSNEVIARIETEVSATHSPTSQPAEKSAQKPEQQNLIEPAPRKDEPKLSPSVRNLLHEHKIDPKEVKTGSDRVTKEDVLKHIGQSTPPVVPDEAPAPVPAPKPAPIT